MFAMVDDQNKVEIYRNEDDDRSTFSCLYCIKKRKKTLKETLNVRKKNEFMTHQETH